MPNNVRIHTEVDGNANKELKGIQDTWRTFQKEGSSGLKIAAGVTAGAAAFSLLDNAASMAIEGVTASIHAASDLNETMTKSEVIFGENSDAVNRWADDMDDAAGQSKRAALDAASGFAGLFKTVGLGIDDSTEMAKKLTQLGSDLASFFNTDVDDALGALKSGLNGESEPLRRFNVFLSETAVAAKLAEMGIKKTGAQFTEAQKATARYALIMEQTGDAQGDFARTSDGLANSTRQLDAKMENLAARVGGVLLPVVEDATTGLLGMADAVDTLTDSAAPAGDKVDVLADAWGSVLGVMTGMGGAFDAFKVAQADAAEASEEAATKHQHAWGPRSREGIDNVTDGSRVARRAFDRLGDKVGDLSDGFKDLKKFANEAGDALAESSYGPEELELAFEGAKLELKDNVREVKRVQDKLDDLEKKGKKAPLALKREFNDAEQAVNDSKQEVIRLGTRLEQTGGISMKGLRSEFSRLHVNINSSEGAARDLYYWMNLIAKTDLGTAFDNAKQGIGGRAIGGPVQSGETYIVGEKGPELFSPSMSGYIIPNDQLQGGGPATMTPAGGGGDTLIVNVNGVAVLTPGSAEALAQHIGPIVTRWQQKRGVIPAGSR